MEIEYKRNIPVIKFVKSIISNRLEIARVSLAAIEYVKYQHDNDKNRLEIMKAILDDSQDYLKNSDDAKSLYAIYYFLIHRDVNRALKYLEAFNNTNNLVAKFSIVFLKLYGNDNLTSFLRAYKQYRKIGDLPQNSLYEIEWFIFTIFELEPSKIQLSFLLFLIYDYLNNTLLATKYLNSFISNYENIVINKNFNNAMNEYKNSYPQLVLN